MEPCLKDREIDLVNEDIKSLYSSMSDVYTRLSVLEKENATHLTNINNIKELFSDIKDTIKEVKLIIFSIFGFGFSVFGGILIYLLTKN